MPKSVADPKKSPKLFLAHLRRFWPWFTVRNTNGGVGAWTLRGVGGKQGAELETRALRRLYDFVAPFPSGMPLCLVEISAACPPRWMRRGQELAAWLRRFGCWSVTKGVVKAVEGDRP
ncbi:hypothetical protein HYH03_010605 [Edaphochlamys debaryana]|nr:hypothetical protein HYH03_010605 [Edaphochlamys debaryana]|eukprot:KAG2490926.1 hypothetical protein HYH03_010605 [Edaphochlamys debaryana]